MRRRILVVVLPFAFDGLVALALAIGDKPAPPASPRTLSMYERAQAREARPGAGLPLLVADAMRSAALRAGKKSHEQRVLR